MKRFYKFLMPLVAIVALALPWSTRAQSLAEYTFATGTDATAWVTLSSSATELTSIYDDDVASSLINIGFTFQFCGVNYTQWSCNSNGRIALGSTAVDTWWVNPFTPTNITNSRVVFPLISALGMDNTLEGTGVWVKYEVVGTAPNRKLVIEYRTPSEYSDEGDLVNYQIQLEETTNIVRFVYGSTAATTYDDFQIGLANSATEVVTVNTNDTVQNGPTSSTWDEWPGVNRYYEFTQPVVSCPRPIYLAVSDINSTGLTLSWTPAGSETSWIVSNGTDNAISTDTFYTFTSLSPNTEYQFSVRALCSVGDTSSESSIAATTACGLITELPYSNDFENDPHYSTVTYANAFPDCWTRINDATGSFNYYPYLTTSASYVHSGSVGMYWYQSTSSTYADNEYAILPGIDPTVYDISDLTLAFYAKTTSTSYHPQPIFGVMTDPTDTTTFTAVHTFSSTAITTTWQMFTVSFANYTGTGNYIAIKWPRPSSSCYMAIDDIFLTDEWCDPASSVAASSTLDEVTLTWTGNASNYVVFLGTDTIYNVSTTSYTFSNLTPNTEYTYGVMADCGGNYSSAVGSTIRTKCPLLDSVPYTMDFEGVPTTTSTSAAFVPCLTRLNNGSQYFGYPYVSSTASYCHSGTRGLYWNNSTTTGTYGDYQVVVMPGIDTNVNPINTLQLKFWARATSSSYHPTFTVGVMTNPDNINTFQPVGIVNVEGTTYAEYTVLLGGYSGEGEYIAIRADRPGTSWNAAIDDITIETMPNCPPVINIEANATIGGALLTWDYMGGYSAPDGYQVVYDSINGNNPTTVTTTDAYLSLSGLEQRTTYKAYVRAMCGSDFGIVDSAEFTTGPFSTIDLDGGTTTSYYLPIGNFYNYSYTQQLVTAAEMGGAATLTGIDFEYAYSSPSTSKNNVSIYLANTSATSLSSSFVTYNANDFKLVYTGNLNCTTGWNHFDFDTVFAYNGTDNLLIVVHDNSGDYDGSSYTFYTHSASGKGRYVQNDGTAYSLTSVSGGTSVAYRTNMRIHFADQGTAVTCANPVATVVAVDTNSISLVWAPGYDESSWDVDYRVAGTTTWQNAVTGTSQTEYTIFGLTPGTSYEVRVLHNCDNTDYYAMLDATTQCVPYALPFTENFDTWATGSSASLPSNCWNRGNNYSSTSNYPYISTSSSHSASNSMYMYSTSSSYSYLAMPAVNASVDSLMISFWIYKSNTSYTHALQVGVMTDPTDYTTFTPVATVQPSEVSTWEYVDVAFDSYTGNGQYIAIVSPNGSYSYPYIDDITIDYIPTCPHVSNIYADYVSNDTVILKWTAGGTETQWEVFNVNDTVQYITDADSVIIDNLAPSTLYSFTVRAICGDADTSWPMTFNTYSACGKISELPFVQDFEGVATGTSSTSSGFVTCWTRVNNGTSYGGYPYVSSTTSYNHTEGGTKGLYWYNSTTTGTYGDYQIVVLPEIDTLAHPINTLMLTFWARPSTASYQPIFYVGTMPHPDSVDAFAYYDTIHVSSSTEWHKFTVMFNNYTDTNSFIAIRANRPGSYWYAYVDDIILDVIPDCAPVEDLDVVAGPVSAMVSWTPMQTYSNGFLVEYRDTSSSIWSQVTTTDSYVALTGLIPNTEYEVRVAGQCDEGNSIAVSKTFHSGEFGCLGLSENMIGDLSSTTTNYTIPVNNYYRNTMSQQLILASELGSTTGTIRSVSFEYAYSNPSTQKNNCEIWIGLTGLTSISSSQYLDTAHMKKLYAGPLNCTQGWNTFSLTGLADSIVYPGDTNVVVCVIDNSNAYDGSAYVFRTTPATGKAMAFYSDSYNFYTTPTSMTTATYSYRTNMKLAIGECTGISTCAQPPAVVTDVTTNSVSIAWTPGNTETAWNLYYCLAGAATLDTAAMNIATTSYQFTNLLSGNNYEFFVEPVCNDDLRTRLTATTECAAIASLPFSEDFDNWGTGTGVLPSCWSRSGSYSTYTYISATYNNGPSAGGSVYMYQGSTATYISRLLLPELDTTVYQANQTQLVFDAYHYSTSYGAPTFIVGVTSNPDDPNTFVGVDTVQHTGTVNQWETFEVPLANYTGNGAYVTIRTLLNGTYFYTYLDNVTLELIPTCPRPDSLMAGNATQNSVDLSWHERGGASNWIIEYGPRGFQLGTGTTVAVSSNPFTLTGLPVGYQGEYYVRSICSSADTGDYSRTACPFAATQIPATLPYTYDFESDAEWQNWQTNTNLNTNNWYRGSAVANGGTHSAYISADQGATYKPYGYNSVVNAAMYRDIDFGNVQSSFTISFDARAGGSLDASYDGLMVFLVDPSIPTIASNQNITSPWGNVNDLYRIATVRIDTTWQTYTASFDTISGIHRVAFFWFNQNTVASHPTLLEPVAVDNIHIEESACPRPVATTVNAVGGSTASLSWYGPASGTYEVIYRPYPNGTTNSFVQTNTNSIVLTGLESMTQYAVWVRKICGTDTSLTSDGVLFTTELCDNAVTVTNFDSTMNTGTSSYSPIGYSTYNYSYTQTIIDTAQLAGLADAGDITAMGFSTASTSAGSYFTNITVYLANLPDSLGNLSSSFIHPSADLPFVKVIDNTDFSYTTTGLQLHGFDTAFTWDGTSRILVSVVRNHGAWTSGSSFNAHTQTSGKMRYAYNDNAPYDYTTVIGGTASTTVGDIYLISCGGGCSAPGALSATDVTYNGATLNWSSNATDFEVSWKATTEATWPTPVAVSGATTYAVTGLVPETDYQFMVRALCDTTEGLVSDWVIGNFTTAELPCFVPTALQADPNYTEASFSWTAVGEETAWTLHIWNSAFDQEFDVTANPYTATGLTQNTTYNAAIKAVCGGGAAESEYGDTISFTTRTCAVVTGVVANATSATTATVTWNATEATSYEVNYGPRGFQTGDGEFVTVTAASANLTGLNPESNYDVYVRALCGTGVQSNWSEAAQFSTPAGDGISTAEGTSLSIYPNPTTSATTIALSGVNGEVTITIVDMNGRVVMSDSMSCEGDCTKTMEVSGLAQGAYFVRISGESTNMVKKLVVK